MIEADEITSFSCPAGATLVGGAPFAPDDLSRAQLLTPHIVAADGGADALAGLGVIPEAVIGDMDSMRGTIPENVRVLRVTEQETTDFEKCLIHIDAPFFIGVGFLGGQLDHTLAVLHGLIRHHVKPVMLIGEVDVAFAAPQAWSMNMAAGERVSFFPIMPCQGLSSSGLRWPIDGLAFATGTQIGTSNAAAGGPITAEFDGPGIVTIVPKVHLEKVVRSLVDAA